MSSTKPAHDSSYRSLHFSVQSRDIMYHVQLLRITYEINQARGETGMHKG